jgi:hypothetical protein
MSWDDGGSSYWIRRFSRISGGTLQKSFFAGSFGALQQFPQEDHNFFDIRY